MAKKAKKINVLLHQEVVAIQAERARSDALFLGIGDGAIATDEQGKIQRVNKVALKLLGYEHIDLLNSWYPKSIIALDENGKTISMMFRPITQAFLTGKAVSSRGFYKKKDGGQLPVAITASPVVVNKKPVGAIEVFRDITDEIESERMKDEFISAASHQLRTPLSAINIYSNMLADGYGGQLTPSQVGILKTILASTSRMNELINTLLNITRLEAGRAIVNLKDTDIVKMVGSLNEELKAEIQKKNLILKVEQTVSYPTLKTDEVFLREVMSNLLYNSIKYTPSGGTITIKVKNNRKRLSFSVKDTGYGIPESERGRVFSKFYRGSNILKQDTTGTGLGLYLVKKIVEYLHGEIRFTSTESKGTTFTINIDSQSAASS